MTRCKSWLLVAPVGAGLVLCSVMQLARTDFSFLRRDDVHSPPPHRRLFRYAAVGRAWQIRDPRTVETKDDAAAPLFGSIMPPLVVCDRPAPIPRKTDLRIARKYGSCDALRKSPQETVIVVLAGVEAVGRMGHHLIEFLHGMQYARDHGALLAIEHGSWATQLISNMWMAVQNDDIVGWSDFFERALCVKMFDHKQELALYQKIIDADTRDLLAYEHQGNLNDYIEHQAYVIRTLYRFHNKEVGKNAIQRPVLNMCSGLDAMFGPQKHAAIYAVVHSRTLEGSDHDRRGVIGLQYLKELAARSGCDPVAASRMAPEYVKAILAPLGMLHKPILFITGDHDDDPAILETLQEDQDIGPNVREIPWQASWEGGDVTAAITATVFIGNPASALSGFIAKARVSLGFDHTYMFRKKDSGGNWVDACDARRIFDKDVMLTGMAR